MSKVPPSWKIEKLLRSTVTLHKVTKEVIDDQFGQAITSEETVIIKTEIQPITLEDMTFLPAGVIKEGDAWAYFLPKYNVEGIEYEVEVDDYITFRGIKYIVRRIEDFPFEDEIVYRRAFLSREVGK